jgi:hypothetical protein
LFLNHHSLLFCLPHKRVAEKVTTDEKMMLPLSRKLTLTKAVQHHFRTIRGHPRTWQKTQTDL